MLVGREQVTSLSRYDHARGAGDGAIAGGLAGFLFGLTFGVLRHRRALGLQRQLRERPRPLAVGFKVGAVLGGITAVFGAALGALGGHEDRFEITP